MWEYKPSDFWAMSLREFWLLYDARVGEPKYGSMTESEVERLYDVLTEAQEAEKRGEKWPLQSDK